MTIDPRPPAHRPGDPLMDRTFRSKALRFVREALDDEDLFNFAELAVHLVVYGPRGAAAILVAHVRDMAVTAVYFEGRAHGLPRPEVLSIITLLAERNHNPNPPPLARGDCDDD